MECSLYIHVPFCTHRCAYCDFNTYAGQQALMPAYVEALCAELGRVGAVAPRDLTLHTIYFGGGTPSLLRSDQFASILAAVRAGFTVTADAEITMEANPGTVSAEGLRATRALGINRISLGVQSANGEELRMLERTHTYLDVLQAVSVARRAGYDNLNLDLIYGLPEQTLETWQSTVRRVIALEPDHISAYALALEHGTPFGRWAQRGLMAAPNPDEAADMYEWLTEELEQAGYDQYEISNWSREGRACRHNLQYWRGLPYLGVGAGAHGYANGYRYSNVLRIQTYLERMQAPHQAAGQDIRPEVFPLSPAAVNQHRQTMDDDMAEFMIMGLRLTAEGIATTKFGGRFGMGLDEVFGKEIAELRRTGLIEEVDSAAGRTTDEKNPKTLRLTKRGRLLGNQVFVRFVD